MSVGVLGGTFDPIHLGHLDVAEAARRALGLERLMLLPANVPPHRSMPQASAAHRFAMAALAIQDRTELVVSDLEMLSDEPSYTSVTLDRLQARGIDMGALVLVTGADAFRDIQTWKDYPQLLDRVPGVGSVHLEDMLLLTDAGPQVWTDIMAADELPEMA